MGKVKELIDPINLTGSPDRSVFYWDENTPYKTKNNNKQVVKTGDEVYCEGGGKKRKIVQIIQIGAGNNNYDIAVLEDGTKVNTKACYINKLDAVLASGVMGFLTSVFIGISVFFVIYYLCS